MRVSLARSERSLEPAAPQLLALAGARVILDASSSSIDANAGPAIEGLVQPIAPRADTLFGPRGACLAGRDGPLFVCDTGHHRLLVWRRAPDRDRMPADLVVGQPDFESEGRNARGAVSASSMNVPTGIACDGTVVAVADAWNHRVLIWRGGIERSNQPPDVIVGQIDRTAALANRGADRPRADTLNWCYGVALHAGKLFIADTGNRRVLVFEKIPERDGASADLVLGEIDFVTRDENAGAAPGAVGMRWPHGIAFANGKLLIADAGNNRVMGWHSMPGGNGAPCDFVLGQRDVKSVDHNQASYLPNATAMNMPYGLAVLGRKLIVADTANSRLLGFEIDSLEMNAPASCVAGQRAFADKGDNRWSFAQRDSVCWPYNVAACGSTLAIADSGNNRVMLWEGAP